VRKIRAACFGVYATSSGSLYGGDGMTGANLDNDRYQKKGMINAFGELCTRAKTLTGEKIDGVPCCYGLENMMTDDIEDECRKCASYLAWN